MANSRNLGGGSVDVPLMAAAVLASNGGGQTNEEVQGLLLELLRDVQAKRTEERQKAERMAMQAVETTKEATAEQRRKQSACNHRKQDNVSTRLVGQHVTGTGQLVLTCQWCGKTYFNPPDLEKGQEGCPRDLLPSADAIGG
jgi:hypothetical protein